MSGATYLCNLPSVQSRAKIRDIHLGMPYLHFCIAYIRLNWHLCMSMHVHQHYVGTCTCLYTCTLSVCHTCTPYMCTLYRPFMYIVLCKYVRTESSSLMQSFHCTQIQVRLVLSLHAREKIQVLMSQGWNVGNMTRAVERGGIKTWADSEVHYKMHRSI